MKQVKGWWFGTEGRRLAFEDNRKIVIGKTHKIKGEIIPCRNGLHFSEKILDALSYAPGSIVYRVIGSGTLVPHGNPTDKYACSERTYVSGGIDISDLLRLFARKCALDVIHLWEPPDIVVKYLKTGGELIRAAAWDAAGTAWTASDAVSDAASAAASAASDAVSVARAAARAASAASDAASDAASAAGTAWTASAARAAAVKKFNRRLTLMVSAAIKGG